MAGELGYLAFVAAIVIAFVLVGVSLAGVYLRNVSLQRLTPSLTYAVFFALLVSFLGLMGAFYNNEFAYTYVANHSNSLLPWYYRLSATWGGHEGSLLLWALIMAGWSAAVAFFSAQQPPIMRTRVLAIMAMIGLSMLAFIFFTSSPFVNSLPMLPVDGEDLNPLLQDPGLIFHPPTLYMGYVGMAVPFAFSMAALWSGRMDSAWIRWMRPWTMLAWMFLTLGISLGSYWAYYELGWGGWWFWDPVENASFMPWLASTALLHSLAVSEKRGVFKAWTIFLSILAFALSLLGTFLVRSGVLTSVHSFASDPERGMFVLGILVVTIGSSLALFAFKGWKLTAESSYALSSKETTLVINNILLVVATIVVLLGTLYPLIAEGLNLGDVSVGAPYFNALFTPLTWLLLVMLGIGPVVKWKKQHPAALIKPMLVFTALSIIIGALLTYLITHGFPMSVWITLALAMWVLLWVGYDILSKVKYKHGIDKLKTLIKQPTSYWAMQLGHIGIVVLCIGVALTSELSVEKDIVLQVGQKLKVNQYSVYLKEIKHDMKTNYDQIKGTVLLTHPDGHVTVLHPEKRSYTVQKQPMTEAAIDGSLARDLYISLGEPISTATANTPETWAVRVYIKPFVRLIWLGSLIIVLGGFLMLLDKRYQVVYQRKAPKPVFEPTPVTEL